jgi:hypothetical protein
MLQLAKAAPVFFEMRDGRRAFIKDLLEFLWLAHVSPPLKDPLCAQGAGSA